MQRQEELSKMNPALLKNITEGYMIKGQHGFVEVKVKAKE